MMYKLLNKYIIDRTDDRVEWMRIFPKELRLMSGRGAYRDDVLVLLFPARIDEIANLEGLREQTGIDALPEWNLTAYLVHMGNANQGYPVQEAIATADGRELDGDEIFALVERIESVFR